MWWNWKAHSNNNYKDKGLFDGQDRETGYDTLMT